MREIEFGSGLVSVRAAAALAGVSHQAVHAWCARGLLVRILTDDGYRIDAAALGRFLAERRAAAAVGIRVTTLRSWTDEAESV